MLPKINPTTTKSWKSLQSHFEDVKNLQMRDLFDSDSGRFSKFHVKLNDVLFDYSKNRITEKTKELLLQLCEDVKLKEAIDSQFSGEKINKTEDRAALHTALRNQSNQPVFVDGKDVMPDVKRVLQQIETFTNKLYAGGFKGYTGKTITDVVNIGVGGSDLGDFMVAEALKSYHSSIKVRFVSNIDGSQIVETLEKVDPETTLFIVVSKTFTTQETMTNANTAKNWFLQKASKSDIAKHFVAVSTNTEEVQEFGIDSTNIFEFWDWVGGRFSLWSSVGLSISCAVGYKNFKELLEGAFEMDEHFQKTDFSENIPVLMALLGVWYNNFFKAASYAILPYDQHLYKFTSYLQQVDMESNGKSIDRNGNTVNYETGPVIFGEPGTNSQHAFFQLIHQGTKLIPADFIASVNAQHSHYDHHNKLLSNFLAQTEALMKGKNEKEITQELTDSGKSEQEIKELMLYKVFEGNKPTNTILLKKLTPKTLGSLIAAYEHKVFVQGVIWNIYSYDQWGVELGKQLANTILPELTSTKSVDSHDSSTNSLISEIKRLKSH